MVRAKPWKTDLNNCEDEQVDEQRNAASQGISLKRGRLPMAQRRVGGRIAGEVFSEDGLFRLLFPTSERRRHGVDHLHRGLLAAIPTTTTITRAIDQRVLVGCSLWVPPGSWPYPESFYRRSARQTRKLMATADLDADAAEPFLAEVAAHHLREPHWYLQLLMVDRAHQGRGLGERLLRPGLQAADREGLACVLETQAERNLSFYVRFGFVVTATTTDPTETATMWTMVRQPR